MTTKVVDSTVSEILQHNSTVEYVEPQKNPIATVPNDELIFGQKHNGIECALCPTAKRACDRAWVSAKNVEVWSKMSTTTLWRWLGKLEKARRIQSFSDMKKIKIDDENGRGRDTANTKRICESPTLKSRTFNRIKEKAIRTPHPNRQWSSRIGLDDKITSA